MTVSVNTKDPGALVSSGAADTYCIHCCFCCIDLTRIKYIYIYTLHGKGL